MRDQIYRFAVKQNKYEWEQDLTRYEPNQIKGWIWLQSLCFWILSKLGCYAKVRVTTIESKVIESKKLDEYIFRMQLQFTCDTGYSTDGLLLLNPHDTDDLLHDCPYVLVSPGDCMPRYRDLKLLALPWVKEPIFIPGEYLYR